MWHSGNSPEESLARVLKELRKTRGISQEEVASLMTKAGFSWRQTTVAKTEAGSRPIRLDEAGALAFLFGLSINDMVGHASNTPRQYRIESAYRVAFSMYLHAALRVDDSKRRLEEAKQEHLAGLAQLRVLRDVYEQASERFAQVFGEEMEELTEEQLDEIRERVARLQESDRAAEEGG